MAISGARTFGFHIDTAVALPHTGSPTFDATTVWHDGVEIVTFNDFGREEVDAHTGLYIVRKMAAGAWTFPVNINFRPLSGAKRDTWNAAVKAGVAVSYRWIEDRNNSASATNVQVVGAFLPTKMMLGASEFGGIVNLQVTCNPAGEEPYVVVTGGSAISYGDT